MERVPVRLGDRSYDIVIEAGSLRRTGRFVREIFGDKPRKAGIVTTRTVAELYLDTVFDSLAHEGFELTPVVLPDGEEHKTIATWETILTRLIEARFERTSILIALGGGVVGDMAGFAAATLLRGIPFIQVPTTIVAQVDSSVGGKVAVNHALGKNLIGSFHQPRGVWIDTRAIGTLDRREVVSGMGEVIKHAVIRDAMFFSFLETNLESIMRFQAPDPVMEQFIAWNCRIKADVVAADEREKGLRAILNYGHTVGHALETVTGYNRFKHGEAVLLGMMAAGEIARARGLFDSSEFDRQNALIRRAGLLCDVERIEPSELLGAMRLDKKVSGGRIRFVLPAGIGKVEVYDDVRNDEILGGIERMLDFCRVERGADSR
ncbi:MAG: 3-dehydroquinate synthase [Candidatus Latescibacterota bacterium]